jgi:hypothetical protein
MKISLKLFLLSTILLIINSNLNGSLLAKRLPKTRLSLTAKKQLIKRNFVTHFLNDCFPETLKKVNPRSSANNAMRGLAAGTAGLAIPTAAIYGFSNGDEFTTGFYGGIPVASSIACSIMAGGSVGTAAYVGTVAALGCANAVRVKSQKKNTPTKK